jgi:hypothetical protein
MIPKSSNGWGWSIVFTERPLHVQDTGSYFPSKKAALRDAMRAVRSERDLFPKGAAKRKGLNPNTIRVVYSR